MKSVCLGYLVALLAFPATAANWPNWRGPDNDGISPEKNLPVQWNENKNIRWRVALPDRGNSTPVVWGQRVFITQAIEKENRRTVMCFDRTNGKMFWQSGVTYDEKDKTHETNPHCSASPVTDGERVVATFASAGVVCYDFNGKELWKRDLGKQSHDWGYAASPIIQGNLCIINHGPGEKTALVALDKKTGKTVWQVDIPEMNPTERTDGFAGKGRGYIGSWSTPIVVKAGGREELIISLPGQLRAFAPATGKDLWSCDGLNPLIYTSPVYGDGAVVTMGGFFGSSMAVKPGGQGDVTKTARLWYEPRTKKNLLGSCVISGGYIYFVNMDGFAECLELASGKSVWNERLNGTGPDSESWSSMVLSGDKLYHMNHSGDTFVLRASPQFEMIATNPLGELSNSSVAIANSEIFLRTHKSLWCVSEVKNTASAE